MATTPGQVSSTPVAEPRGLAVVSTTPRLRLSTPIVVPSTTGVVTSYPEEVPGTATRVRSTPGAVPSTPAEQGTPSTLIVFVSSPSDITKFVDAFHEGEEVQTNQLSSTNRCTNALNLICYYQQLGSTRSMAAMMIITN